MSVVRVSVRVSLRLMPSADPDSSPLPRTECPLLHHLLPTVFIVHVDLHPLLWPAHVTRLPDMVIVQLNRGSLRAEIVFWATEALTAAERTVIRLGYDQDPDLRRPIRDDLLDGLVETMPIPPCLRLPAANPLVPAQSA